MSVDVGTRLGSLEITALLGKGGMGEVYRARDTKLKRDVAIKVLPDGFARDAERVARFQREAEVLASLNHPNIASIYDLLEEQGARYLVLELIEGETLADSIQRGPIPVEEALDIAKHLCEALEAAHEKGIIHRDLKPANVKLTPDGKVKVLDFGLAKAFETQAAGMNLSNSPTLVSASVPGVILGTAAYMSPEQAKGQEANRASDVWAFGCVLYEMLTGRSPFQGETVSEVFAGILKEEPDWNRLPAETPENIRRLLRRCLRKERRLRLQHFGDARVEIEEPQIGNLVQPIPGRTAPLAWVWVVGLAFVTLIAAIAIVRDFRHPIPAAPEMRLEITTPPTSDPASLAISPDGQKIVFIGTSQGRSRLWLRSLDSVSARPLPGTDGAAYPFWSPDSRRIGFFADSNLKRIDTSSGAIQTLAKAPGIRGGTWNRDGTILFSPLLSSPIYRILAEGGEPAAVTRLEAQQTSHRFPQFLPDGRHFLYYVVSGSPDVSGIYIGQLDGAGTRRLLAADAAAVYTSSGQLLFVRQGTLFAQNFDYVRLALAGDPFVVAEQVMIDYASTNLVAMSASAAGPIVYRTDSGGGQRQLAWFDRSGKEIGKVGDLIANFGQSLSPDASRVALGRNVNGNYDIWLLELGRGIFSRLTFDAAIDTSPIWSPDGGRIVFRSNRKGTYDLYEKALGDAGTEELLLPTPQSKIPLDWSGRFLLYVSLDPRTSNDLWVLPMDGDRKSFAVVRTDYDDRDGQFSPDGKWIAYASNKSGQFEIYVQPFPGPGVEKQMSTNGGTQVRWRRDGKELFYIALHDRLMAVPIRTDSMGKTIDAGTPVPLFSTRVGGSLQQIVWTAYSVSPDGQRFLMSTVTEEAPPPITVLLNWKPKP